MICCDGGTSCVHLMVQITMSNGGEYITSYPSTYVHQALTMSLFLFQTSTLNVPVATSSSLSGTVRDSEAGHERLLPPSST